MRALIIGNSDGIGLAVTKKLLDRQWNVVGLSRSDSPIDGPYYQHIVADVQDDGYVRHLEDAARGEEPLDLCIHCVGMGEMLDPEDMSLEPQIIDVNFTSMVKAASTVIPPMVKRGEGHFIGLSSQADDMHSPQAPSYFASKAGCSNYLESLALALKSKGVHITNVRFGFVNTKMAKGPVKPLMMSTEAAANHLLRCISKKPMRYTAPKGMIPLVKISKWFLELHVLMSKGIRG